MWNDRPRPRLTRYDDVALVVQELRKFGIGNNDIYRRVTEIGPVDLDMLSDILTRKPDDRVAA